MSRRKYLQLEDGDWFEPPHRGFSEQCCDCALVHTVDYRIVAGRVQFRATVDRRATAAARRAFKFPKENDD